MTFVYDSLKDPSVSAIKKQEALDRIYSDPDYPEAGAKSTKSFWLQNPHSTLHQLQSSRLLSTADTVIIGSGITGASVARALLQSREKQVKVDCDSSTSSIPAAVMLESRNICSGATGRNSSYILETAEEYSGLEETYGAEPA